MKRKPKSRVPLTKGRSIPKAKPYPRIPEKTKKVRKRPTKQSKPVVKKKKVKKKKWKRKKRRQVNYFNIPTSVDDGKEKKVLIGVPIYNRKFYLKQLINEFVRTKIDMNLVYLFDDGSSDETYIELVKRLQEQHQFHLIFEEHVGTLKTLRRIVKFFEDKCDFFYYIEDDAIFSLNWFKYGIEIINFIKGKVGFLSLYTPMKCRAYGRTKLNSVRVIQQPAHFWGAVCCLLNTKISPLLKIWGNPDMIMLRAARKLKKEAFISCPTVVDHTGIKNNKLYHSSEDFYGRKKDALKLLPKKMRKHGK